MIPTIKLHPVWYAIIAAGLFVSLIIVINYFTITVAGQNQLKNQLKNLTSEIQAIENSAQRDTKDINRFQAKKYGIEPITQSDLITP